MKSRLLSSLAGLALATGFAATNPVSAQTTLPAAGLSNYGMPGLIDMPTATLLPDGTLAVTVQAMPHTQRVTLVFQALPRLTVSFRYARLENTDYRQRFGNILHDRSFDLHWQMVNEGQYMPAIAIGLRDFIGTGAYSSEYIVASRSFTPRFRGSLGMGWGRLATHGEFSNPLGVLSDRFRTRPRGFSGQGGLAEVGRFFRGPAAIFAGAEYQATDRLTLVAEYSSDGYLGERPNIRHRTPINLGFRYRMGPSTTVSGYLLHGTSVGIAASFALNPAQPSHGGVRVSAPPPVRLRPAPVAGGDFSTSWVAEAAGQGPQIRAALAPALAREGVRLEGIELEARRAVLRVTNQRHEVLPRAIGRTARVMTRALPHSIEEIVIIPMHGGVAGTAVTLRRSDLERYELSPDGAERLLAGARFSDPLGFPGVGRMWQALPEGRDRFEWAIGPYMQTMLFDPETAIRADIGVQATLRYNVSENFSANLRLQQRLLGNIDGGRIGRDTITDPRFIPRVRMGSVLYSSDRPTVERMTLDYTIRPAANVYGRVTLGWLERMYAGISTELLWSPPDGRLALGVEVNRVAQRAPGTLLGVNELRLTTGHVSAYYAFDRGFFGQIDVGRFLAGDVGARFRLERVFANGMRIGAYATLTNMPFDQFGEGSFDKGITLTIPVTSLLGRPSISMPASTIQSLSRDGGAMLRVPGRLYPTIQDSRAQALRRGWGAVLQ